MIIGHLAVSYLLTQAPLLFGIKLSPLEEIYIVASGYLPDLDLLFARFFVRQEANHHLMPTHTPLFVLGIFLLSFLFLGNLFRVIMIVLALAAMFLHLVLDDIGYWFAKLGWQKVSKDPQIFWFYPFDKRRKRFADSILDSEGNVSNRDILISYISGAKVNVALEIILAIFGIWIFIRG